jgi:spore coat polysaccharide biosynthesis protein SpsF
MGSARLPGKVLEDIGGETMLVRVVKRTKQSRLLNEIVVATTTAQKDNAIVNECKRLNLQVYRGEEHDVLDRYYQTAVVYQFDTIVRITSDCPLIDPTVIDRVIAAFLSKHPDYASNFIERTYPQGLETEIMTMSALSRTWESAVEKYQRTHVTPFIYQNPNIFSLLSVKGEADWSHMRWTVDTPEDLSFMRAVYERLGNNTSISWKDVLHLLERQPELVEVNHHIRQKYLQEG